MGEQDSTAPVHSLEVSISFGRFEKDLLSWEKWSTFSQNKYLEEVEKCATPGSVAEKKAYFEARNKLIAMRKMEVSQESSEEPLQGLDLCGNGANQYDEEVMEENIFESGMSSPDIGEQVDLKTDLFESQETVGEDMVEDTSVDQFIVEEDAEETIFESEASYPVVIDNSTMEADVFELESKLPEKDDQEDKPCKNNSEFNNYDEKSTTETVKAEVIMRELRSCSADETFDMETNGLGSTNTFVENHVDDALGMDSLFYVSNDSPVEVKENTELGSSMSDQLKVDYESVCINSTQHEVEILTLNDTMNIHYSETEKKVLEPESIAELPANLENKSAQPHEVEACIINITQKSSKKQVLPAHKPRVVEKAKMTPVSSVSRPPQMSTSKTSKPSPPPVASASRASPISRVKKTAISAVPKKSPQTYNPVGLTQKPKTPSMIPAFQSPSNKASSYSLSLSKKSSSVGVSRKPTPTSLHMSLNFGPKVMASSAVSSTASVTEPRRSLFMEKMGDKEIVKRAFRAFRNMSIPSSYASDMNAPPNKVVRNKADTEPSAILLRKEKDRLVKKGGFNEKNKKNAPSIFKSHDLDDKRKEVKKVFERAKPKEAAKTSIQPKYKEKDTHAGERRQCLSYKATPLTNFYQGQRLSKSFQDKGDAQ